MPGFETSQRQIQKQTQTLSQKQIQSLKVLNMSSGDLRDMIYKEVESNPALTITKDSFLAGAEKVKAAKTSQGPLDLTKVRNTSHTGELASDNYQKAMEAVSDDRETLKEHLLSQLNMVNISQKKYNLCKKLILNLNTKGFHNYSPESLLSTNATKEDRKFLQECMEFVQQLDPPGTCVKDTTESLFVQAKQKENTPPFALLILDGHLEFLVSKVPEKISKKINDFIKEQKSLFGKEQELEEANCTPEDAQNVLNFIRSLDLFPARNFNQVESSIDLEDGHRDTTVANKYITPDVYVKRMKDSEDASSFESGIVTDGTVSFKIKLAEEKFPTLEISDTYKKFTSQEEQEKLKKTARDQLKKINKEIKQAQSFIEDIKYRQNTVFQAAFFIVQKQIEFFKKGPGHLAPLTQKELAQHLEVHASTISRTVNDKYIYCKWGVFEMKSFFTNLVNDATESGEAISKDNVMHAISLILKEHKDDRKKLSDQKICDLLAERGIKIARRTVAKYRGQMKVESSYNRI